MGLGLNRWWSDRATIGDTHRAREMAAFLPAALEIQERPPHPIAQWLARALLILVCVAIAWAFFGKVNVVATAEGKIIPSQRVKQIQPLEKAVVKRVLVSEGDFVSQGQPLVELDSTLATADEGRLSSELSAVSSQKNVSEQFLKISELSAEEQAAITYDKLAWVEENTGYQQLLWRQWQDHYSEKRRMIEAVKRNSSELQSVEASIKKLSMILPIVEQRVKKLGGLHDQDYVSEIDYLAAEQERIQISQDLISERHRKEQLEASRQELQLQLDVFEAQVRARHWQTVLDARQKIDALEEELVKIRDVKAKRVLYAPVDGYIQQLAVSTIGGVVTDAQVLMLLVPREAVLEVEVMLPNKDIGFVREGMETEIKIHTFPFTKYGLIAGDVKTISNDAIIDENLGLVYSMRVAMQKSSLVVNGSEVQLMPGMAVTAEVQIGKRRVIEFIAAPLLRGVKESLRER